MFTSSERGNINRLDKWYVPSPPLPPTQSNLLTQHPPPLQSDPSLIMQNQQNTHFQQGSSKPTQFQNMTYASPRICSLYFSVLPSRTTACRSMQVPRSLAIRVCLWLDFALCESIDRVKLIRGFSLQLRSRNGNVRTRLQN